MSPVNERLKRNELIPGGTHTYSKGDDQYPSTAPCYIERGEGAYIWDECGKKYLDWGMGLRAVSLGHAYPAVTKAAINQMRNGSNFNRPSHLEEELAELLVNLIPSFEMVKFAKNGSTVTTAALKLARAYTGRKYIAYCADHPFFSYDDWFIGTTICNSGIPEEHYKYSLGFRYNQISTLEELFKQYPNEIAAVILEPVTTELPRDGFLQKVRELCHENGAVLIFDEMITGFRWHLQGAQTYFDVMPDLTTFGKGIGNGFAVAVLGGRRDILELGGLEHRQRKVFLISTTHGAELHALAAAKRTIEIMQEQDVVGHMHAIGESLISGIQGLIGQFALKEKVNISGFSSHFNLNFQFSEGINPYALRTLFLQELCRGNVLLPYAAPSYSHTQSDVSATLEVMSRSFAKLREVYEYPQMIDELLEGPVIKPVFRAFNYCLQENCGKLNSNAKQLSCCEIENE